MMLQGGLFRLFVRSLVLLRYYLVSAHLSSAPQIISTIMSACICNFFLGFLIIFHSLNTISNDYLYSE